MRETENTEFLRQLYEAHGARAIARDGWVFVDEGLIQTRSAIVQKSQHPNLTVVQFDVQTITRSGHDIIESCAGVGSSLDAAVHDARAAFARATFHVLFAAFLQRPCEHVTIDEWAIGGLRRTVSLSELFMRGDVPYDAWPAAFAAIERQVCSLQLDRASHWMRYFHQEVPGQPATSEVLFDNRVASQLQQAAETFPWPKSDRFYSVRIFLVVSELPTA